MNRIVKIFMPLVILALVMSTGCSMVQLNTERDAKIVVATVKDEVVTKEEWQQLYNYQKQSNNITEEDEKDYHKREAIKALKENCLNSLVLRKLEIIRAKELGLDQFTAEEQAAIDADYQAQVDYYVTNQQSYNPKAEDESDEEYEERLKEITDRFIEANAEVFSKVKNEIVENALIQKLMDHETKDVTVADSDVVLAYNANLSAAKENYAEAPNNWEAAMRDGSIVYFNPDNSRRVKSILIALPDDTQAQIRTLRTDNRAADADALLEEALKIIEEKANEILQKAKNGDDYDALMQEHSDDPGKTSDPDGYYVAGEGTSTWVTPYAEAARKLEKVGDITSELVASDYGYFVIKLEELTPDGDVAYEDVKDALKEERLVEAKNAAFAELESQWPVEYKVKKYLNRCK